MSASGRRNVRRKRPRSGRGRSRHPSIEVLDDLGEDTLPDIRPPGRARTRVREPEPTIDLTCADGADDDIVVTRAVLPVVDLTNVIDSPIVIGTPDSPPRRRNRTRIPSNSDSDSDLQELPPIPFPISDSAPSTMIGGPASGGDVALPSSSSSLPAPSRTVTCPVCLDTADEVQSSGRQLCSTICGHVFCNICISDSIKRLKCCPSCRRKLTGKQFHPLFI